MNKHKGSDKFLLAEYKRLHHKIASLSATQAEQNKCQEIEFELRQRGQLKLLQGGRIKRTTNHEYPRHICD